MDTLSGYGGLGAGRAAFGAAAVRARGAGCAAGGWPARSGRVLLVSANAGRQ